MSENIPPSDDSKSELKRKMLTLQKLGETLVQLSSSELEQIPLEPFLRDAILHAKTITAHGGKRRQLQYIGRLMRNVDAEPIQTALNKLQLKNQQGKAQFHQVERWRDRLIAEGDAAITLFIEKFPECDHQQLRQLVRNAHQKKSGSDTALFRFVREWMA